MGALLEKGTRVVVAIAGGKLERAVIVADSDPKLGPFVRFQRSGHCSRWPRRYVFTDLDEALFAAREFERERKAAR